MRSDGRSEDSEGFEHASGIVGSRSNEDIEVTGSSRQTMGGERMGSHDDEVDLRCEESTEQVDEVFVELRLHVRFPSS